MTTEELEYVQQTAIHGRPLHWDYTSKLLAYCKYLEIAFERAQAAKPAHTCECAIRKEEI